jgi:hypothetical protein
VWTGTRWPWATAVLAAVLAFNPLGIGILNAAFSGDPLSRAIWRPIFLTGIVLLGGIAIIEWQLRLFIQRRRARRTPHS